MIHENITKLRKHSGFSQEDVADKIGVTRQTIAKWEAGESVPDVIHCSDLAELFGVSLDDLVNTKWGKDGIAGLPPKGKYIFGTVTIGEKGQIVIPAKARRVFNLKAGDDLVVLGDIQQGIALAKTDFFLECFNIMKKKGSNEK